MTFKNKRILLICREVYSYPFYFLVDKWAENNCVAAYFFSPSETKYHSNPSNETSYCAFVKNKRIKIYDANTISDEFTSILNQEDVIDIDYLDYIEKEYTHYLNINQQVLSTQSLTRHYHYRNFWAKCNYSQQLNWIILNYKQAISIIDEFKPDILLDCDNAELGRCVLREICYKKGIPYIYMDNPRYELYKTFSYSLGFQISDYLRLAYDRFIIGEDSAIQEELQYVDDFRKKKEIMHPMYKNDITSKYKPDGLIKSLRSIYSVCRLLLKQDVVSGNFREKSRNPLLYPSSYEYLKFAIRQQYRRERLLRNNRYFDIPKKGEKYVYMPLHLIPESTTFTLAPLYINELQIIEAVSKSLPAGWVLYVKEHQAMLGERPIDFYKAVNKIPNAKMVQLNYYTDPLPWIIHSQGVVTISGTSAFEAALLGKKSIVFSNVAFSLINSIFQVKSLEELPHILATFSENIDNKKSCAAYVAAVKKYGFPIDMKYIINHAGEYILDENTPDAKFMENINNVENLFYNGYLMYCENHKNEE